MNVVFKILIFIKRVLSKIKIVKFTSVSNLSAQDDERATELFMRTKRNKNEKCYCFLSFFSLIGCIILFNEFHWPVDNPLSFIGLFCYNAFNLQNRIRSVKIFPLKRCFESTLLRRRKVASKKILRQGNYQTKFLRWFLHIWLNAPLSSFMQSLLSLSKIYFYLKKYTYIC